MSFLPVKDLVSLDLLLGQEFLFLLSLLRTVKQMLLLGAFIDTEQVSLWWDLCRVCFLQDLPARFSRRSHQTSVNACGMHIVKEIITLTGILQAVFLL